MINFNDDVAEFPLSDSGKIAKDIEVWLVRFILEKVALKRKTSTIRSYKAAIANFVNFCKLHEENITIETITARFVNRYLLWYQEEVALEKYKKGKIKKSILDDIKLEQAKKDLGRNDASFTIHETFENTLSHRLTVLKDLLKFISENNKELHDFTKLFDKFAHIIISEKMTDYLTPSELKKVTEEMKLWPLRFKSVNRKPKSSLRVAYRDSLLILLYCYTGARSEEIVLVKFKDITEEAGNYIIKIEQGKGGKKRAVSVKKELIEEHLEYLSEHSKGEEQYLSAAYHNKNSIYKDTAMSPNTIRKFENFILKYLNIKKSGLHAVRRGFATKKIANDGVDISLVAKQLGNTIAVLEKHYLKHAVYTDKEDA